MADAAEPKKVIVAITSRVVADRALAMLNAAGDLEMMRVVVGVPSEQVEAETMIALLALVQDRKKHFNAEQLAEVERAVKEFNLTFSRYETELPAPPPGKPS